VGRLSPIVLLQASSLEASHLGYRETTLQSDELAGFALGHAGTLSAEEGLALAEAYGGAHPFIWDSREQLTRASPAFRVLMGLPADAPLTEETVLATLHPADREAALAYQEAALARGGDYELEFRIRRGDGRVRWIRSRGRVVLDATGRGCGIAGMNMDVTARKEAEEALAASEGRLRTILDTMPQIVWSTRADGHHDFYNARWYEFTGVPQGSTDGDGWNGLFHPDDQERAWNRWRESLGTGAPYEIEYRLRRHDGSYRWTLGRALPIRDRAGQIERWFGTCTDIEDLKNAEEARELVARELAHRIKNIFAVVSSLLVLSSRGRAEAREFAEDARARIESLARAHDYVRLVPGRGDDAGPTVRGLILALLEPYADGRRIRVDGTDCPIGTTAGTSLALVVHELATNAIKYGALATAKGTLSVTVDMADDALLMAWHERGGPTIEGPPVHRGFGTTLSERALRGQLGGRLETEWDPDGLTARILIPITRLAY